MLAANAAYLQAISQLLTRASMPHVTLQGSPADPGQVRASLQQQDWAAGTSSAVPWAADELVWVQSLADSFAWCRAHGKAEVSTSVEQVQLFAHAVATVW